MKMDNNEYIGVRKIFESYNLRKIVIRSILDVSYPKSTIFNLWSEMFNRHIGFNLLVLII